MLFVKENKARHDTTVGHVKLPGDVQFGCLSRRFSLIISGHRITSYPAVYTCISCLMGTSLRSFTHPTYPCVLCLPVGWVKQQRDVPIRPMYLPRLHVLDNQLRTDDSAKFIHIEPVGDMYLLATSWQHLRVEGNTIDLAIAALGA